MSKDCTLKRAQFIAKIHSLNQEFHFSDQETVLRLCNIYALSFYGSNSWNLYSEDCERLYKSWNVAVRILFNVPRDTHRYLIESLSKVRHIKTVLCSRFVQFYNSLKECSRLSIRMLIKLSHNDYRTVMCRNLNNVAQDCNIDVNMLSKNYVLENLKYLNMPDDQAWRVPILVELINARSNNLINGFDYNELSDMINFICSD